MNIRKIKVPSIHTTQILIAAIANGGNKEYPGISEKSESIRTEPM
jgi:hypothetical protein